MDIIIAGGGRVGYHLARLLSEERHNVTVIEVDPNQIEHIDYTLDVSTIVGSAVDAMLLQSAGAGSADLFLAATGDDEINLIAAAMAKGFGAKQVLARAHQTLYVESDILYETVLGIDYILSPEALTAKEIVTYIENPGMVAMESFGRGLIEIRHVRVSKSPLGPGQTLKDMELPSGVLLGVIGRNGKTEIPHGGSTIQEHDVVTLVGCKDSMGPAKSLFQGVEMKLEKVVIMGGSTVGLSLAQTLEKRGLSVKIFDWNITRCNEMAAILTKSKVVCRDAASRLALEQEHVGGADIFVAVTRDDERNIMACVLAKEVGAKETLAIVHQPDFAPLVDRLGIDHAVTPRASVANRVLKLANQKNVSSLAVLDEGRIEILEFKVSADGAVLGHRLSDIKFPKDSLVA